MSIFVNIYTPSFYCISVITVVSMFIRHSVAYAPPSLQLPTQRGRPPGACAHSFLFYSTTLFFIN